MLPVDCVAVNGAHWGLRAYAEGLPAGRIIEVWGDLDRDALGRA